MTDNKDEKETKCTRNAPGINHCGVCGEFIPDSHVVMWDCVANVPYHMGCYENKFDLTKLNP